MVPSARRDQPRDVLKQDRTAWSFEVEARPFKEKW
jgi:hypothetical protein